jgi:hypothetical protein
MAMAKKAPILAMGLSFLIACANTRPKAENAFSYRGKPIHPDCVSQLLLTESRRLSLKEFHPSSGFEEWEDRPGFLIAEYPEQEFEGRRPYFAYMLIGQSGGTFIIWTEEWGGGSGRFSNILFVDKSPDELRLVEALGAGDRCNGGITGAQLEGSDLYYFRDTTPIGIIGEADEKLDLVAYEDLENSAASCVAQVKYRYSLVDRSHELISVTLAGKLSDQEDWTDRYTYQSCFNKVFNTYVDAGKTELSRVELNEFIREFKKECLNKQ